MLGHKNDSRQAFDIQKENLEMVFFNGKVWAFFIFG